MRTVGGGGNDILNLGPIKFKELQRLLCGMSHGTPVAGAVDFISLSKCEGCPYFSAPSCYLSFLDDKRRTEMISTLLKETYHTRRTAKM